MNKTLADLFLGILTGVFFANSIWLAPSFDSALNVLFAIMSLLGFLIINKQSL
jgi:formate/nitrite transporter FocA (FNT family)